MYDAGRLLLQVNLCFITTQPGHIIINQNKAKHAVLCELIFIVHWHELKPLAAMVIFSHCLFCLSNSLKHKNIQFTVIYNKEEMQILTFKKLDPENYNIFSIQLIY